MSPAVASDAAMLRDAALAMLATFLREPSLDLAPAAAAKAAGAVEAAVGTSARHGVSACGAADVTRRISDLAGSLHSLAGGPKAAAAAKLAEEEAWMDELLRKVAQSGARRVLEKDLVARVDQVVAGGSPDVAEFGLDGARQFDGVDQAAQAPAGQVESGAHATPEEVLVETSRPAAEEAPEPAAPEKQVAEAPPAPAPPAAPSAHYVALNGGGRDDFNFDPTIADEYRDDTDFGFRIREVTESELIRELQEKYVAAAAAAAAAAASPSTEDTTADAPGGDDELLCAGAEEEAEAEGEEAEAKLKGRRPPAVSFSEGDMANDHPSEGASTATAAGQPPTPSDAAAPGRLKGLVRRVSSSVAAAFGSGPPSPSAAQGAEASPAEDAPTFGSTAPAEETAQASPEVPPPHGFTWGDAVYIPPGAPAAEGGIAGVAQAILAAQGQGHAPADASGAAPDGFAYVQQVTGFTYAQPVKPQDVAQTALPHALASRLKERRAREGPHCKYPSSGDDFYPVELDGVVYDSFALRVVHERDRTGFEDSKEFPIKINSIIAGRYQVIEYLGSAAFSRAVQCLDLQTNRMVCMKIIKNDKDFMDQSLDEIKLLRLINANAESMDEKHCLSLIDYMYHKEHLIIVTELLRDNLYEFSKFNRENNHEPYFTLGRLQRIAKQVLVALEYIHGLWLIHADLKPENILIKSYSRCEVKVIDFGSSCFIDDALTSYIQSRSYRAPEVMLGLPYDQRIDVWSLGCILAELWTGYVLFQNDSVQSLLARILGIIGPFPQHMLSAGRFVPQYFTQEGHLYRDIEVPGSTMPPPHERRLILYFPKRSSLRQRMRTDDDTFVDFLRCLLEVDPALRSSAKQALQHPWLQSGRYSDGLQ